MNMLFATNNKHKLEEIRSILGDAVRISSLEEVGCKEDIPETASTLEGNALLKASFVWKRYGLPCFADDTGLEVEALNGEPGVRSARYDEQTDHDSEANMRKLLRNLQGITHRKARFRTVIVLLLPGEKGGEPRQFMFEGIVNGHIAEAKSGTEGFGYDPVFIPEGYRESFAELGAEVKNRISHRAKAVQQLADFLKNRADELR